MHCRSAGLQACLLVAVALGAAPAVAAQTARTTFTKDIAPIVFAQCATCHRPGGTSFSLLTYADVKGRARLIAETTHNRIMPPWKPDPGAGEFVGERRLSGAQIAIIQQWVDDGTVEGDPFALPPTPQFTSEWHLGPPDLILT